MSEFATPEVAARFWAKTKVNPETGCIEWTGTKLCPQQNANYGRFRTGGKLFLAHRFAWYIKYGVHPDQFVCHSCDIPSCVNVDHMFVASHRENMDDMVAKKRKVSSFDADAIRSSDELIYVLAVRYGLTVRTIYDIKSGKSWKPLTVAENNSTLEL